ncbi:hemagglutinin repeat-containing protein [Acinetobacter soli]|nr:hemagglutinin repeat-containing protein [Acinetobacter soli]
MQGGNTTNIIGAQVQGKGVQVDAKALNIESLQNTANYNSTQQNIEGQVTVDIGTEVSASGSANKTNINANYALVQDQTEIHVDDVPHLRTHFQNQTEYDTNGIAVGGCVNIKAIRIVLEKIKEGRSTNNINLKSILKRFYLYYFN